MTGPARGAASEQAVHGVAGERNVGKSGWSIGAPAGSSSSRSGERRRGDPRARGVHHVVAEEAHRQHPPAPGCASAAGGVQREHVEEHRVARLQLPTEDSEAFRVAVDVGQLGQRAVGEPLGLAVEERPRHVPRPAVRAGDELAASMARATGSTGIHIADVLPAVDVVVRLVLVPRRALAGARLLDEDVVVVEPHDAACPSARRR